MNEPWSHFQEIVFDVMFINDGWAYIGYGRLARFKALPSQTELVLPSTQSTSLALNGIE